MKSLVNKPISTASLRRHQHARRQIRFTSPIRRSYWGTIRFTFSLAIRLSCCVNTTCCFPHNPFAGLFRLWLIFFSLVPDHNLRAWHEARGEEGKRPLPERVSTGSRDDRTLTQSTVQHAIGSLMASNEGKGRKFNSHVSQRFPEALWMCGNKGPQPNKSVSEQK